ncbi:MAG TPA: UDP-N-acetylmuramoyl-tripeptide--D-alanyl-D-alanine ligase [Casimicrobiaceae bacterium]|nr:UDP-N-acetylmuramoyl-tripeptide--D-alanyl-D-alanine ligase [Casimicrobiaceae bacterium]
MDTATAARAVDGRMLGGNVLFSRVATDSRTLVAGDLFVAIKGENFDGHDFVAAAFERGAVAAIVAEDRAGALAGNLVVVEEPLAALGRLAAHWRARFAIPVIVVVGSNGKTTVKEMLAGILRAHYGEQRVLVTQGNFNNAIGLPLTLLRLRDEHAAAAIELGMNHPGETAELAAIVQPTVALVNNAQREHQEFMNSVADVALEHAALVRSLRAGGTAVVNADDPSVDVWRAAARERPGVRVVDFALAHPAAIRLRSAHAGTGEMQIATPAGDATLIVNAPGRHNLSNALAAAGAAVAIDVPLAAIVAGLEAFRPVAGRLATLRTAAGVTVIDDTYNANPDSVRAAIDVLAAAPQPRWLALGDMGEVGASGPQFHREVGAYARAAGVDLLFTAGAATVESDAGFGEGARHFASVGALAAHLAASARAGTTILVKGSRVMRMERVVAALTGNADPGAH